MLRSCLRAVEAISRIPGVNACEPWRNFMQVQDRVIGILLYRGEASEMSTVVASASA